MTPATGRAQSCPAAAAKLFITAAGATDALGICSPLFETLGQRTFFLGREPQAANLIKLSGNFLIASMIEALGRPSPWSGRPGLIDASTYS